MYYTVCEIGGRQVARATRKRSVATYFDQLVAATSTSTTGLMRRNDSFAYFALHAHNDTYCTSVHV